MTHASPAGSFAKSADRRWENDAAVVENGQDPTQCRDIADQLIHSHPGKNFKVSQFVYGSDYFNKML